MTEDDDTLSLLDQEIEEWMSRPYLSITLNLKPLGLAILGALYVWRKLQQ